MPMPMPMPMPTTEEPLRIGVLWRGEAGARTPPEDRGLGQLLHALGAIPAEVVPVPFGDDRVEEVRRQVGRLDGVLAWVNPIQDGANRRRVDELLREAAAKGIWVSAHPKVIEKMGTKEVLYRTRHLGWGSDTTCYRTLDELAERLPDRLARLGRLVVKQGRGNGGNGVWSVELADRAGPATLDSPAHVRQARADDAGERISLREFVRRCGPCFPWSEVLIDQEYQPRLADGMIRCYFSHDEVVGFCHQWPVGLLDAGSVTPRRARTAHEMEGPEVAAYQQLRQQAEKEWVPEMARAVGLDMRELPVIWDADFLYGPKDEHARDSYVLCEINVSAVWPFPPMASSTIALHTAARVVESRQARQGNGPRPSTR